MRFRFLSLLVVCALHLGAQTRRTPSHPVVLISIDGLKPEYVLGADEYGLKIPNLRALVERGTHASAVVGVVPTVTYPSHTTLVTGVSPARHGVLSNTTFDPLAKNQEGWYWYASDIRVPTLWDEVTTSGRTTGNVHWPVTVGANITWNLPQYWRTGEADDRKLQRALSTPGLYDAMEREVGVPYALGFDETVESDELRVRFATRMMESRHPTLMLAYFTSLDTEEHHSGPFSPAALATLERIDAIVGAMIASARRAYGDSAVIAVVSDHGFERTTKNVNLVYALRSVGLMTFPQGVYDKPSSWRAAVWADGGSAAIVLKDPADSETRDNVGSLLRSIAADSANGIDRVIDGIELRRGGGFTGAAYLVSLKPDYAIGNDARGPLITSKPVGGTHGYLPDAPAMRASFIIAGPGIPRGRDLGVIDQRAIAPTLAKVLGVRLPRAEVPGLLP